MEHLNSCHVGVKSAIEFFEAAHWITVQKHNIKNGKGVEYNTKLLKKLPELEMVTNAPATEEEQPQLLMRNDMLAPKSEPSSWKEDRRNLFTVFPVPEYDTDGLLPFAAPTEPFPHQK